MKFFQHIGTLARKYLSAAFIPCLLLSAVFWYMIKLSYTYTATIPVRVSVEGQRIKANCLVEATGYRLFVHRYVLRNRIAVGLEEAGAVPSVVNKNSYVLNPFALQNIISVRNIDLRILSVGELPEITLPAKE